MTLLEERLELCLRSSFKKPEFPQLNSALMKKVQTNKAAEAKEMLLPETALEHQLIEDESWLTGAFWGKPRRGHPEGMVLYHIKEVLDNVNKVTTDPVERSRLRLITFTHDTFKYQEDHMRPRDWSKHHAVYAVKFAKKYIKDQTVIDIIELHDEAYYAWRAIHHMQDFSRANKLLNKIKTRVGNNFQLFYLFFKCDTLTGDKTIEPIKWFEELHHEEIQPVHF